MPVSAIQMRAVRSLEAVTTRRLAELIDYSQPVLYSHFKGKADIMGAVALRGFEDLTERLRQAKANVAEEPDILRKVCAAYLDFARSRPVIYEAMFVLPTGIKFASEDTPPPLRAAFAGLWRRHHPEHASAIEADLEAAREVAAASDHMSIRDHYGAGSC